MGSVARKNNKIFMVTNCAVKMSKNPKTEKIAKKRGLENCSFFLLAFGLPFPFYFEKLSPYDFNYFRIA